MCCRYIDEVDFPLTLGNAVFHRIRGNPSVFWFSISRWIPSHFSQFNSFLSNFTLSSSKFPTVFQLAWQSSFDVKMIIDKFLWQQHFKESIGWQLQSIFLFFKFNSKSKLSKESFEFLKNTFCIEVWSRRSKSSICAKWSVSVSSQWWQSKVV